MPIIQVNGVDLYYEEYGSGDEIVISAQQRFGAGSYQEKLSEPPTGCRVYNIQIRGYGKSTHVTEDLGTQWYPTWAEDVYQFSRLLGIDKFIYTGVSHGAGIGWQLVMTYPEAVKAFVSVVGAPHDRAGGRYRRPAQWTIDAANNPELAKGAGDVFYVPTTDPKRLERRAQLTEERAAWRSSLTREELLINPRKPFPDCKTNEDLAERLSQVKVPTLLLCGAQDDIISAEMSLLAARSVPGAKAVFFQDHSHALAGEIPERLRSEFKLFIDEVNAGLV